MPISTFRPYNVNFFEQPVNDLYFVKNCVHKNFLQKKRKICSFDKLPDRINWRDRSESLPWVDGHLGNKQLRVYISFAGSKRVVESEMKVFILTKSFLVSTITFLILRIGCVTFDALMHHEFRHNSFIHRQLFYSQRHIDVAVFPIFSEI